MDDLHELVLDLLDNGTVVEEIREQAEKAIARYYDEQNEKMTRADSDLIQY